MKNNKTLLRAPQEKTTGQRHTRETATQDGRLPSTLFMASHGQLTVLMWLLRKSNEPNETGGVTHKDTERERQRAKKTLSHPLERSKSLACCHLLVWREANVFLFFLFPPPQSKLYLPSEDAEQHSESERGRCIYFHFI